MIFYTVAKDEQGKWYVSGVLGTEEVVKVYAGTHDEIIDLYLDLTGARGRA